MVFWRVVSPGAVAVVKPVDVASLPEIKLRTGSYEKFTRLVFDWPRDVSYQVFPGAAKMTVRFGAPVFSRMWSWKWKGLKPVSEWSCAGWVWRFCRNWP